MFSWRRTDQSRSYATALAQKAQRTGFLSRLKDRLGPQTLYNVFLAVRHGRHGQAKGDCHFLPIGAVREEQWLFLRPGERPFTLDGKGFGV